MLTTGPEGHSTYEELLAHPPPGVRYHPRPLSWGAPVHDERSRDALYWKLRGLRRRVCGEPERAPVPDWGAPVHSANQLLRSPRPWVVDFEHPNAFVSFDGDLLRTPRTRRRLERAFADCGALLPWSEAAGRAVKALVPSVAPKVRVIPPAVAPRPPAQTDPGAPLVLFVGRHFRRKGGIEAVEAFCRARAERAPTARMLVISNADEAVRAQYATQGIDFWQSPVPRERVLSEGFGRASVFLMPTHYDTFGMVFLEAFASAVPVITLDTFAADELVEDGVDGYVLPGFRAKWFDPKDSLPTRDGGWRWETVRSRHGAEEREEVVSRIARALGDLLVDPTRSRRMGEAGRAKVVSGRFSVGARSTDLLAAYEKAFDAR